MNRSRAVAEYQAGRTFPLGSWYVAANADEVTQELLGRRMLGIPIVLFRTPGGQATALEDRCVHRAFPLSKGHLDGDRVVCGYHGFEYAPDGRCVRVPSQEQVPFGARVRSFPVRDDGTFVWIWAGEPALATLRPPPSVPWLADPQWATLGGQDDVAADYLLLHETFADVTHVPYIDPDISPLVLKTTPPPLEVEITETSVSFSRTYPAAPLPEWHWRATGLRPDEPYEQRESGRFTAPGLWVDSWDVHARDRVYSMRFTQAVTPVTTTTSGLVWRLSRNFAVGDAAADEVLQAAFSQYYIRVKETVEAVQEVIAGSGHRRDVSVNADLAALQVRKIIRVMINEESGRPARDELVAPTRAGTRSGGTNGR